MQFNSHATNLDIVSEINALCDSDGTSYPIADKTRRVNSALEELVGKIINADGNWEWDDTNYSDQPRGRATLVQAQSSYSFASEYLKIEQIDVLDTDGRTYRRLKQLTREDLGDLTPEEYFGTNSSGTYPNNIALGTVTHYDIVGDSVMLYNAPTSTSATLTNGLRIWFKRTASLFTTTDTTKEPGIPSPYHILLAYKAAIPYCMNYWQ